MGTPTTISFRTVIEKKDELDKVAESLDRDRSWVINRAIDNFLELQSWQADQVRKGLKDLESGRFVSHEEMKKRITKMVRKKNGK